MRYLTDLTLMDSVQVDGVAGFAMGWRLCDGHIRAIKDEEGFDESFK
jgi:hypothetical protein